MENILIGVAIWLVLIAVFGGGLLLVRAQHKREKEEGLPTWNWWEADEESD